VKTVENVLGRVLFWLALHLHLPRLRGTTCPVGCWSETGDGRCQQLLRGSPDNDWCMSRSFVLDSSWDHTVFSTGEWFCSVLDWLTSEWSH